jgi:hypothetical protein
MKNKCGNDELHLESPPRDSRCLGGRVGDVERRESRSGGEVRNNRDPPTRIKRQLEIQFLGRRKNKALRSSQPIETVDEGETLQKDGRGGLTNDPRGQRRSRVDRNGGVSGGIDIKGATT